MVALYRIIYMYFGEACYLSKYIIYTILDWIKAIINIKYPSFANVHKNKEFKINFHNVEDSQ